LFEQRLYRCEFILFPLWPRSTENRLRREFSGRHFLGYFFFAVEKEVGRRKGETMT
jgi:hypothetical protein